jgi:hypothetical protein
MQPQSGMHKGHSHTGCIRNALATSKLTMDGIRGRHFVLDDRDAWSEFLAYVGYAADEVVGGGLFGFDGDGFDGRDRIMRAEY